MKFPLLFRAINFLEREVLQKERIRSLFFEAFFKKIDELCHGVLGKGSRLPPSLRPRPVCLKKRSVQIVERNPFVFGFSNPRFGIEGTWAGDFHLIDVLLSLHRLVEDIDPIPGRGTHFIS